MKAVIFDLDNTLIDFVARKNRIVKACVRAMIHAGLKESFETLHKDFSEYYWQRIEDQKIFQKYLNQRFGEVDYRIVAHAIIAYRKANSELLKHYPGADELLMFLKQKGFKIAILSDAPRLEAFLRLCQVGFDRYFDIILTKDDVKATKPDPKGFLMVAKALGVKPVDCIMVGDKPEKDVAGAKGLGMTTIYAKYGNPEDSGKSADFIANSPREIIKIIQKLN